jgi:hypothetical protein
LIQRASVASLLLMSTIMHFSMTHRAVLMCRHRVGNLLSALLSALFMQTMQCCPRSGTGLVHVIVTRTAYSLHKLHKLMALASCASLQMEAWVAAVLPRGQASVSV